MPLVITRDVEDFAARTEAFLQERLEHNVLATVLHGIRHRGGFGKDPPLYAYRHSDDGPGRVEAAALRTPPWPLLAASFDAPDQAEELIRWWFREDPLVPGVSAEPTTAQAISRAWQTVTGGHAEREFAEAMHTLTRVTAPTRPSPGELRQALPEDRPLLVAWERAFVRESGLGTGENAEPTINRRLAHDLQFVWVDGRPVSTVGINPAVAGTSRIGPVYTPPEHRNRGYATTAVAAVSQLLLDRGVERCMLFTDLANPISNRIYAAIGYVRFAEWEQHGFHAPS